MQKGRSVQIKIGGISLSGDLSLPEGALGIILFAHGSGSSRLSPRNQYVAVELNKAGFATLLMDLLSSKEEAIDQYTRHLRFDIPLLAGRLRSAIDWLKQDKETQRFPIGLFGASTGSAAAIIAAAEANNAVAAVVSRGGRTDLASSHLAVLQTPTLLIVGGADVQVIELNKEAMVQMRCTCKLEIVAGATHLFEEPGTLEAVAQLASRWFLQYMTPPSKELTYRHSPAR